LPTRIPPAAAHEEIAASKDEDVQVRLDRALQRYFNERYQTYGRFVRFTSCFSDSSRTAEARRSDAVAHLSRFRPFSFNNLSEGANRDEYSDVLLRRKLLGFSAVPFLPAPTFRRHSPLYWGFMASIEEYAEHVSAYVCTKVVPFPVSNTGNTADRGGPRRLGLLRTDNPGYPGLQKLALLVRERVTACGGNFVAEATYPTVFGIDVETRRPGYGQENMARFQQDGVTTVIWPGGWETEQSRAAASLGYRPEWIMAGDYQVEGYDVGQLQEQSVWQYAVVMTNVTREGQFEENLCYLAALEADPEFPRQDASYACPLGQVYESLRQLFTGIQVAGPKLTPGTMERGYRAIPAVRSNDARVPACFYDPGEFTCVKDAQAMWWDPSAAPRNNTRGCWRMMEGGRRYLTAAWPGGDILAQKDAGRDVCNGFAASGLGG